MFLRRYEVFDYGNNRFFKPSGEFNTSPEGSTYQLPNCTHYAILRAYEACDKAVKGVAKKGTYDYGGAKGWYANTGLPKGSELREGAIAVFDGTSGHVLFVERKLDATHADCTESNFSANKKLRDWHFFNRRANLELVVGKATVPGAGKLLGFIYVPINEARVSRNVNVEQVEISAEMVNCRQSPAGPLVSKGAYIPEGIYNVYMSQSVNGTMWYQIAEGCWVSDGWWLTHYEPNKLDELWKALDNIDDNIKVLREGIPSVMLTH